MEKFNAGTLVTLKSGGPVMTAGATGNDYVECYWFDKNDVEHNQNFPEYALEIFTPPTGS